MDPAWREHFEALKRFNEWEDKQLRAQPADYVAGLAWLAEAEEVVDRLGPPEDRQVVRDRHLHEILEMRAALARAGLEP